METPPPKRSFWMVPFTVHATRGLLRDQSSRRKTMAVSVAVALLLLIAGLTVLRPWLDPHEHPWRFILFWLACAWETVLVLLLALFDLLLLRANARAARKAFQEDLSKESAASPNENAKRDQNPS
jgi:hypothetical protein